jgi:hypothetical protein
VTAIYISPPAPSLGAASFSGQLEAAGPDNAGIMQKAVYIPRTARIGAAWVSGVDGLGEASGTTVIRLSNQPFDRQDGATGFELILAVGQSVAQASGSVTVPAGGWLYVFITQASGGHYGAQVGFEISWQESLT